MSAFVLVITAGPDYDTTLRLRRGTGHVLGRHHEARHASRFEDGTYVAWGAQEAGAQRGRMRQSASAD